MAKRRRVVKSKLNEWYNWLVDFVPNPIKSVINKGFSIVKNIINLYNGSKKTLKYAMEKKAKKNNLEYTEDEADLKALRCMGYQYVTLMVSLLK